MFPPSYHIAVFTCPLLTFYFIYITPLKSLSHFSTYLTPLKYLSFFSINLTLLLVSLHCKSFSHSTQVLMSLHSSMLISFLFLYNSNLALFSFHSSLYLTFLLYLSNSDPYLTSLHTYSLHSEPYLPPLLTVSHSTKVLFIISLLISLYFVFSCHIFPYCSNIPYILYLSHFTPVLTSLSLSHYRLSLFTSFLSCLYLFIPLSLSHYLLITLLWAFLILLLS